MLDLACFLKIVSKNQINGQKMLNIPHFKFRESQSPPYCLLQGTKTSSTFKPPASVNIKEDWRDRWGGLHV